MSKLERIMHVILHIFYETSPDLLEAVYAQRENINPFTASQLKLAMDNFPVCGNENFMLIFFQSLYNKK